MDKAVELATQSDSIIIILLVVIALIIVGLVPVIKLVSGIARTKRKDDYERENRLIGVIERNTEVNSALKTLIETDQKNCKDCRKDQMMMFKQLQDNQDVANIKLSEIHTIIVKKGD